MPDAIEAMNPFRTNRELSASSLTPQATVGLVAVLLLQSWPALASAGSFGEPAPYEKTIRLNESQAELESVTLPVNRRACVHETAIAANHRNRPGRINTMGLCESGTPAPIAGREVTVIEHSENLGPQEVEVRPYN